MNQDMYHREQEARQQAQRMRASKHTTMETVQLEEDAAEAGQVPKGEFDTAPPAPTLWQRLKRLFARS